MHATVDALVTPSVATRAPLVIGLLAALLVACNAGDDAADPANPGDVASGGATTARCGDGAVQDPEACDDGNSIEQDFCRSNCVLSACGDGIVHFVLGEQCDDGNTDDGDGCSKSCQREAATGSCGDGVTQKGEACDDGNAVEQDFCRNDCKVSRCGDGVVHFVLGEECDDGNVDANDGCSADCRRESCGDGIVQDSEQCDDGNVVAGDGCTSLCLSEGCGDGVVQTGLGETCDDANVVSDDGCDDDCRPSAVTAISGGVEHTCVLTRRGSVRCFGEGGSGRLGYAVDGSFGDDEFPSVAGNVPLGSKATQIASGFRHSCALLENGNVRCWGEGLYGQLGYGNTANRTGASAGDVPVGGAVRQIAAGFTHTCALLTSGAVRCWGDGASGKLGRGTTTNIGDDETPASVGDVNIGGLAVAISAGPEHTCALLAAGKVRCWGLGDFGRLGYGNQTTIGDNETPASAGDVAIGFPAVAIVAGGEHTCALSSAGKVRCWGKNWYGQAGYPNEGQDIGDDELPASAGDVVVGDTVTALAAGAAHTCALLATGAVRCFGEARFGKLGSANEVEVGKNMTPAAVGNVSLGAPATRVGAGYHHTCIITDTGALRCWGFGAAGQLGYGNTHQIGDDETPASVGDAPVF